MELHYQYLHIRYRIFLDSLEKNVLPWRTTQKLEFLKFMTNTTQFMWSVQNPKNRNCQNSKFVFLVHDLNLFYSANSFMQDMSSLNCNYQLNYTPKSALDTKAILKSFTNCCFYSNSRSCRWSRIKYFNSIA